MTSSPLLALTLGEPAGIGLDVTIDAWLARRELALPPFLFVGDADALTRRASVLGRRIPVARVDPDEAAKTFADALPCLRGVELVGGAPGVIDARDTAAVIASIRTAVSLVRERRAGAVVTNPIHKKALNAIGFPFPGHTEYLAELGGELYGAARRPVMMIAGPDLRVVPVTIHVPLASVPAALTRELIVETATITAHDLRNRFGLPRPRLALAGLNPHAGEDGMLGHEDDAVIRPAVEALRLAGIDVAGPLSADTMFYPAMRATYDVAICMYHDQALIPAKTLAFDEGVNVTLGLPFVRTSPDHGTALPLAGGGKARPDSLVAALRLAAELAAREAGG